MVNESDPRQGAPNKWYLASAADEPVASFVIHHAQDAGDVAVDRYHQATKLLTDAGIAYSVVTGDAQGEASELAGMTDSDMPKGPTQPN